ncbi:ElyC/SanA/YdcF family protein [Pseudaestuariivita sp.]|uniref:ElyC/SanA/YdcF family protein n=1 Tax=Pseudaestuariivita sp. TaxID=2211669 RepID=UPI00405812E4
MRRVLTLLLCLVALFLTPWAYLRATTQFETPGSAPEVEAALIFGALVRDGAISPLHQERLDAGRALLEAGKTEVIVVSNAARAAAAMQAYLSDTGVPPGAIELDGAAPSTPDTCRNEAAKAPPRRVAFVSNGFHLPRIRLHCTRYDLDAVYVVADDPNRAEAPLLTRIRVRGYRFVRENLLTWAVLLRIYPSG